MYAQLGDIRFEALIGFDQWERTSSVTYARHKLIQNKPRMAVTGIDLLELKVSIRFHRQFCIPEDEVATIENAMLNGLVLPLIFGNGRVIGEFVIERISEKLEQTDIDGNITSATLGIELTEYYVVNKAAFKQENVKRSATGLASNNPQTLRGVPQGYFSPGSVAVIEVSNANVQCIETDKLLQEVQRRPDKTANNSRRIQQAMQAVMTGLGVANSIIQGDSVLQTLSPFLPGDLTNVINLATNMKAAMPISNLNSVLAINSTLQASMSQAKLSTAPLNAAFAFKKI